MISYQITIMKIETDIPFEDQEYKQIGEEDGEPKYGYVKFPSTKQLTTEVYSQTVDDIDTVAVINAVNNKG